MRCFGFHIGYFLRGCVKLYLFAVSEGELRRRKCLTSSSGCPLGVARASLSWHCWLLEVGGTNMTDKLSQLGMMHCFVMSCTMRMKQCLVNQERGKVIKCSIYQNCQNCQSGCNVKKHLKRKITLDEVIPVKEQARQVLQQKMDGNFVLLLRKQEMINQMRDELKKQGKTETEIELFLIDIRSGNTQAARAVWQQVVFNN